MKLMIVTARQPLSQGQHVMFQGAAWVQIGIPEFSADSRSCSCDDVPAPRTCNYPSASQCKFGCSREVSCSSQEDSAATAGGRQHSNNTHKEFVSQLRASCNHDLQLSQLFYSRFGQRNLITYGDKEDQNLAAIARKGAALPRNRVKVIQGSAAPQTQLPAPGRRTLPGLQFREPAAGCQQRKTPEPLVS